MDDRIEALGEIIKRHLLREGHKLWKSIVVKVLSGTVHRKRRDLNYWVHEDIYSTIVRVFMQRKRSGRTIHR